MFNPCLEKKLLFPSGTCSAALNVRSVKTPVTGRRNFLSRRVLVPREFLCCFPVAQEKFPRAVGPSVRTACVVELDRPGGRCLRHAVETESMPWAPVASDLGWRSKWRRMPGRGERWASGAGGFSSPSPTQAKAGMAAGSGRAEKLTRGAHVSTRLITS